MEDTGEESGWGMCSNISVFFNGGLEGANLGVGGVRDLLGEGRSEIVYQQ